MANNKKVDQNERSEEAEERKRLEKILAFVADDVEALTVEAEEIIKKRQKVKIDYEELKHEVNTEAEELVVETAKFFFTEEEMKSQLYVIERMRADRLTISGLLFQMKTSEHAIIKLLELIDEGNVLPRQFEVLSSLQRAKMDIVKHLATIITLLQNNYKNLKHEYDMKDSSQKVEDAQLIESGETSLLTHGSKDLIKSIRSVISKQDEEKKIRDEEFERLDDEKSR